MEPDIETLKGMLERNQYVVNCKDLSTGTTMLSRAIEDGRIDACKLLLSFHADANIPNKRGQTSLHIAALRGRTEMVDLLLRHNADSNSRDRDGKTPLHSAAGSGRLDVCRLLLHHGADRNIRDNKGKTPFNHAMDNGYAEVSALLIPFTCPATEDMQQTFANLAQCAAIIAWGLPQYLQAQAAQTVK